MATYLELRGLFSDGDLANKVVMATVIEAQTIAERISPVPTTAEKAWIEAVFESPVTQGGKVLMAVLAANKSTSVAGIQGASDSVIQTNVSNIVPILVDALAGV